MNVKQCVPNLHSYRSFFILKAPIHLFWDTGVLGNAIWENSFCAQRSHVVSKAEKQCSFHHKSQYMVEWSL